MAERFPIVRTDVSAPSPTPDTPLAHPCRCSPPSGVVLCSLGLACTPLRGGGALLAIVPLGEGFPGTRMRPPSRPSLGGFSRSESGNAPSRDAPSEVLLDPPPNDSIHHRPIPLLCSRYDRAKVRSWARPSRGGHAVVSAPKEPRSGGPGGHHV